MSADELSRELRARVAALHEARSEAAEPLSSDARQRVTARLQREAQRLQQQRRRRRGAFVVSGVLAAAAAVLLMKRVAPQVSQPTAATSPTNAAVAVAPACGLPSVADEIPFERLPDERRLLTLGTFGELVVSAAAEVRVERSGACELALRLVSGELAGDLHSLRPARLTVRTEAGDVVITGTRFFVRSDTARQTQMEVVLASGVVDVVFPDRASVRLSPNTRLRRATPAEAPSTAPLSNEDQRQLDVLLSRERTALPSAPAAVPPPPVVRPRAAERSHDRSLLERAEAERRAQHFAEARALYRAAAQHNDDSAEVALLRWVRLELEVSDPQAAARVLTQHGRRFARGRLGAEAGWLEVQISQALQQPQRAHEAAQKLRARFPGTPQADAAARVLGTPTPRLPRTP